MAADRRPRVVLAEDNALLREGLARLLEDRPDVELVGEARDLPDLLALVDELRPDVVLTDIRMPPTHADEGVEAATSLRRTHPDTGVVVLSQHATAAFALRLLEDGSHGRAYLLKDRVSDTDQLIDAIHTLAAGGSVIDPDVVEALVAGRRARASSDLERLTPREREVLAEMAQGKTNGAIAAHLVLSERAVEKHAGSIFTKLGLTEEPNVNRRVTAVLLYLAEQEPS
jgi:DNA-binding NarL/FixJ family response regulator